MKEETNFKIENVFPTTLFHTSKLEFLDLVTSISNDYFFLDNTKLDECYPVKMTPDFSHDSRLNEFKKFIGGVCWSILDVQGYDVENMSLYFSAMWSQKHFKYSLMEQHVHNFNTVFSGFYFLNTPENSSRLIFHDPRPGKVQINLPQKDISVASEASTIINFQPSPGLLFLSNSWIPHSFSRNCSSEPFTFVHFTLSIASNIEFLDQSQVLHTKPEVVIV